MRRPVRSPHPIWLLAALCALPATAGAQTVSTPIEGPEGRLHALVNDHRREVGCAALLWYQPAAEVAEHRSADMMERHYFDHVTPDGDNVFDELRDAGITSRSSAENIALTVAGAGAAYEMWRDSPPHRQNLDNCAFTHEGIGQRRGVWTQILLENPAVTPPAATPRR